MSDQQRNNKRTHMPRRGRNSRKKDIENEPTVSPYFPATSRNVKLDLSDCMPSPIEADEILPKTTVENSCTNSPVQNSKNITMKYQAKLTSNYLSESILADFESPINVKRTTKSKPKLKPTSRPKRQLKIKSAFLRNEELFSEVTTQHCLVDNINPDDMQLALALSRSEAEVCSVAVSQPPSKELDNKESIRDKLKNFGFQVADREDYNFIDMIPKNKKSKWANKFTPLTLRNPRRQIEKLERKINEIIEKQIAEKITEKCDLRQTHQVRSEILHPIVCTADRIVDLDWLEKQATEDFYVPGLVEPSTISAGHLLKDFHKIPGRERTPDRMSDVNNKHLLATHPDNDLRSPAIKKIKREHVDEVASVNDHQPQQNETKTAIEAPAERFDTHVLHESRLQEPTVSISTTTISFVQPSTSKTHESVIIQSTSNNLSAISASRRATSPDIFADSDGDFEMETNDSMTNSGCEPIITYEHFSSDEVKTGLEHIADIAEKTSETADIIVDLTQSDTSSQHSTKSFASNASSKNLNKSIFPCNTSQLIEEDPIGFPYSLETNALLYSNGIFPSESPTDLVSTGLCFKKDDMKTTRSSTSFNEYFTMNPDETIDLTQDAADIEDDCIVLSDDEINYSIWKANKTNFLDDTDKRSNPYDVDNFPHPESTKVNEEHNNVNHEFSFMDLIAESQSGSTQSEEFKFTNKSLSNDSLNSLDIDLSKRSEFGVIEEISPFKTPTKTPKKSSTKTVGSSKCRRTLSDTFGESPGESAAPLKRFSTASKFCEFAKSDDESLSDLDEIDKLIYGSPSKRVYKKPAGLTQLLTGTLNDINNSPVKIAPESPKEFEFNGRTYLVRTTEVVQQPNFREMTDVSLLDQLYRFGIKPLKRKQAIKMLEYLYNQMHPYLVDEEESNSDGVDKSHCSVSSLEDDDGIRDMKVPSEINCSNVKLTFKDCSGDVLINHHQTSMEINNEVYVFQTNTSKKISTALLPLHVAWHNLVKSNAQLHEAILHYEPIDLQDIYLFFKSLGYRYDPKDLKCFFDTRAIIFRYDLSKPGSDRHIRKRVRDKRKK